jgi:hypothetical protein
MLALYVLYIAVCAFGDQMMQSITWCFSCCSKARRGAAASGTWTWTTTAEDREKLAAAVAVAEAEEVAAAVGLSVQVESQFMTHSLKAPSFETLEPKTYLLAGFKICFQMGQFVPLHCGGAACCGYERRHREPLRRGGGGGGGGGARRRRDHGDRDQEREERGDHGGALHVDP